MFGPTVCRFARRSSNDPSCHLATVHWNTNGDPDPVVSRASATPLDRIESTGYVRCEPLGAQEGFPFVPGQAPHLWAIVTCKARLEFLQVTAPRLLKQGVNYCLVDYDCSQHSGEWLSDFAAVACSPGRVAVVRHSPAPRFHKTHALNLGAAEAIRNGATHLMFSDADTIHAPGSADAALALIEQQSFVIAGRDDSDQPIRSLTGFILLSTQDFVAAGGYDASMIGWGAEDIEFRLRLHLRQGLRFRELQHRYLQPMAHSDALRTEFQDEKDLDASNERNIAVVERKVQQWTGLRLQELSPLAWRLLFGEGPPRSRGSAELAQAARDAC
jgi:hypothetical protein